MLVRVCVLLLLMAEVCWGLWGYRCLRTRIAYPPAPLKISCSAFGDKLVKLLECLCVAFYDLVTKVTSVIAMAECLQFAADGDAVFFWDMAYMRMKCRAVTFIRTYTPFRMD